MAPENNVNFINVDTENNYVKPMHRKKMSCGGSALNFFNFIV